MTELALNRAEPFFNLEPLGLQIRHQLQTNPKVERSLLFPPPLVLVRALSSIATSSMLLLFLINRKDS
ncbi:hypothetical protein MLD38_015185 [Melastoma candidum]|uniref:Uncharacterized protein n=1 Tax=Melastoma candidum TaxID=119954 RepID=A0ACB9RJG8_9MYRT|nr:hypothetical protein MLD38_015185 [Melastoma candidum]